MSNVRGKSMRALCRDIAEGYVTVNPIFLKSFDAEATKEIYHEMMKTQAEIRAERFPHNDIEAIRSRNMRLQRLHVSSMIVKTWARDRRILLV